MMIVSQLVIVFFTVRFYVKVMKAPKRPEPDSYLFNDEDKKEKE